MHDAVHNEESGFSGSLNCFFHNRTGQTVNLDIHLNGGNTLFRSGDLKVHIAEEIFQTLNIGQHQIILIRLSGNQTARDSGNRLLNRHTGSHQGHTGRTGGSHRCGTVGLHRLGNGTNRIRELFHGRKHRKKGTLCKSTMSDFSSSRSSRSLRLSYGVSREVVLVKIALLGLEFIHPLYFLYLGKRRKGRDI